MNTQDIVAVNTITGRASNQQHLKEGSVSKSEVKTLLPDIQTQRLHQIQMYFNHMLKDGVVTYGEFLRFLRLVDVSRREVENGARLQKLAKSGVALPINATKGKDKTVSNAALASVDLDF